MSPGEPLPLIKGILETPLDSHAQGERVHMYPDTFSSFTYIAKRYHKLFLSIHKNTLACVCAPADQMSNTTVVYVGNFRTKLLTLLLHNHSFLKTHL